jgi:hypothetical protein
LFRLAALLAWACRRRHFDFFAGCKCVVEDYVFLRKESSYEKEN